MYSYTTTPAPQVIYAKRPVKVESIATTMGYVKPIDRVIKGKADGQSDSIPG